MLWSIIGCAGANIGRTAYISPTSDFDLFANVYIIYVGDDKKAKEKAMECGKNPLELSGYHSFFSNSRFNSVMNAYSSKKELMLYLTEFDELADGRNELLGALGSAYTMPIHKDASNTNRVKNIYPTILSATDYNGIKKITNGEFKEACIFVHVEKDNLPIKILKTNELKITPQWQKVYLQEIREKWTRMGKRKMAFTPEGIELANHLAKHELKHIGDIRLENYSKGRLLHLLKIAMIKTIYDKLDDIDAPAILWSHTLLYLTEQRMNLCMKNLDSTTKKLWLAETIFCFLIDAKNGKTIDEICNHFGKERREINAALKVLDGKNKIQTVVDSDNKTKFLIQELNEENEVLNLNWFRDNGVIA
jgi:hypothetical protein